MAPRFSLAIGLGANLPSPAGEPLATLLALRPLLAEALAEQWGAWGLERPRLRWSPLVCSQAVGGPPGQPNYLNAVLLVEGEGAPQPARAEQLLQCLQGLERQFGRERRERWGPRLLDLDLLWCGSRIRSGGELELPHPRLAGRAFVLAPLAAIDPDLVPPLPEQPPLSCGARLAALLALGQEAAPARLPPQQGWPE